MRVIEREEERKIWLKKAFGLLILILLLLTFSRLLYIYSVQLMRTHMENFFRRFSFLVHTEKEEEEKKKGTKRVFLYSILANDVKSMGVHGIFFFQSFFISFFFLALKCHLRSVWRFEHIGMILFSFVWK